ncbi:MAG: hydroxymethylglutaryl-CoA lyase [Rhodospirillales bacterium]|jgi:isopropylmalate/homocitrate/citramalate synthase|nr:hydroxymethylglutaryl-CoA lyase [Rhodospirillales bacterium]
MRLPHAVTVVEVGPRDGLQNEPGPVPTAVKIALIDRLGAAGLPVIEAGSFVQPRRVPQMADTAAVLAGIGRRAGARYPVLVPNVEGLRRAVAAGAAEVAVFAAASESFSRRNLNCSIEGSFERYREVCAAAAAAGVPVRGYVSCVLGCPYEGDVPASAVAEVAAALHAMGCFEISLGDTIGAGTPARAAAVVEAVSDRLPREALAVHFHDTYGQALANILACLQAGIGVVDASVAGLGGCPFAPGAAGNVATEDVVYMLDGLGVQSGIDLARIAEAGRFICRVLGREPASKAAQALAARCSP